MGNSLTALYHLRPSDPPPPHPPHTRRLCPPLSPRVSQLAANTAPGLTPPWGPLPPTGSEPVRLPPLQREARC